LVYVEADAYKEMRNNAYDIVHVGFMQAKSKIIFTWISHQKTILAN